MSEASKKAFEFSQYLNCKDTERSLAGMILVNLIRAVIAENAARDMIEVPLVPTDDGSDPMYDHPAPRAATAEAWVPTEEQVNKVSVENDVHIWYRHLIKFGMIAGHRIARENQCSKESSPPLSAPRSGTGSAGETATKPDTPMESSTPSPKSGASSLDERAEALFAANPEWRPRSNDQALSLQFHKGRWTWLSINWFLVDLSPATALAHLLAALLPRAVKQWTWRHRNKDQFGPLGLFSFEVHEQPPFDLESAINILEKP